MFISKNRIPAVVCAAGALVGFLLTPPALASASAPTETTRSSSVTSPTCVAQVQAIASERGVDAGEAADLCSGTVTTTK